MKLTHDDLAAVLDSFEQSEWTELTFTVNGLEVRLSKTEAPSAPAPPAAPVPAPAPAGPRLHEVRSPSVGIVSLAVEAGARVEPGDVIGQVAAMRTEHPVEAGAAGTVRAIHVEEGEFVEHAQPLFEIDADG